MQVTSSLKLIIVAFLMIPKKSIFNEKRWMLLFFAITLNGLCIFDQKLYAQDSLVHHKSDSSILVQKASDKRKWVVASVQTGLWATTLLSLEKSWYSNYAKRSFHTFNDWNEWQQMDKFGHLYSAYQITDHTTRLWQWAGMDMKRSILLGAISSQVFLNAVELMDAYSAKWGFSHSDAIANLVGTGLYVGQAIGWKEQRIKLKFSYHPINYGSLEPRADQLFGNAVVERILKDYNGQTYWASVNLKSFMKESPVPGWLCLSIGYGADNMLGGFSNQWINAAGEKIDRNDIPRGRKWLLSADIDLTKLRSNSRFLKTIFSMFNSVKIPAPAIIINSNGKLDLELFYF